MVAQLRVRTVWQAQTRSSQTVLELECRLSEESDFNGIWWTIKIVLWEMFLRVFWNVQSPTIRKKYHLSQYKGKTGLGDRKVTANKWWFKKRIGYVGLLICSSTREWFEWGRKEDERGRILENESRMA